MHMERRETGRSLRPFHPFHTCSEAAPNLPTNSMVRFHFVRWVLRPEIHRCPGTVRRHGHTSNMYEKSDLTRPYKKRCRQKDLRLRLPTVVLLENCRVRAQKQPAQP